MCRNIKTLFNFDPPATDEEIRAASVQFVRKLSGFTQPSKANEMVFNSAVDDVANVARRLIDSLVTTASPRDQGRVGGACAGTRRPNVSRSGRASGALVDDALPSWRLFLLLPPIVLEN
jgi:hypothetical protein